MKEKILVAGASGSLGLEITKLLHHDDVPLRGLVHSANGAARIAPFTEDVCIADASKGTSEIENITDGISTVISALGKSVSLFTSHGNSFLEIDFFANNNLLDDAKRNGVKRFIYISIKGAETGKDYKIADSHRKFEEALEASGLDYTIIRPVGFFSGLNDLAIMAKRKVIPVIGTGEARTNSIHQKDLAEFVVKHINSEEKVLEVGGPLIHTRMEMAEMIREKVGGKILHIPEKVVDFGMFLPKIVSDAIPAKLNYFKYVMMHDMTGQKTGSITFQQYLNDLDLNDLP